jgi:cyclopropane fatty-acyl-phospholipid synthase-like methyltransferase
MSAEFGTVAEWTAEVAVDMGADYYVPAGCRGSGSPAALDWLMEGMALRPGDTLLDCGAGVGGPSAYASEHRSVTPVLVEPEAGACRAAHRLFEHPVVQASATALPFADQSVDAAWSLGVMCTMSDHLTLLTELRRVVRPPGRIGLLVFVAREDIPDDERPEGNHFPTTGSLAGHVDAAGLRVQDWISTADLPAIPQPWQDSLDEVSNALERRYGGKRLWEVAEEQSGRMGRLLGERKISGALVSLRHV